MEHHWSLPFGRGTGGVAFLHHGHSNFQQGSPTLSSAGYNCVKGGVDAAQRSSRGCLPRRGDCWEEGALPWDVEALLDELVHENTHKGVVGGSQISGKKLALVFWLAAPPVEQDVCL
jgi:hypothetical protein